jgi:hypothetical protein
MSAVWSAKSFFGIGGVDTFSGVRSTIVDVVVLDVNIAGSGATVLRNEGNSGLLNFFLPKDIVWFFVDVVFSFSASA